MGYKKKGDVSGSLGLQLVWSRVALSILTPFSSKSAEKWEGTAQTPKLDEGGPRGVWKLLFYVIIWVLYTFLPMLKQIYMFLRSMNPFFKVLTKIQPFVFSKTLVLPKITLQGHFRGFTRNPFNFLYFVNVEWKKTIQKYILKIWALKTYLFGRGSHMSITENCTIGLHRGQWTFVPTHFNGECSGCK